jgi:transmembrane sensor
MQKPADKALLRKFINNACTKEELVQVHQLFKQPGTEELFQEILNEREIDIPDEPAHEKQMQEWKAEFKERIETDRPSAPPFPIHYSNKFTYLKYAAAIVVLSVGIAFYASYFKKNQPVQQIAMREIGNPYGQRSKITLPDSSVVFLGAASKIRFPEKFTGNTRTVELEGEAFFDIVHKAEQPMIVRSGTVQSRDLGTSFKITAFKDQPYQVQVTSGKVSMERLDNQKATRLADLSPGEMATWDEKAVTTAKIEIEDVDGWKEGRLVFNAMPLQELAKEIERFYGVSIKFRNPARRKVHVTTVLTINDTPVNRIMKALSVSANFRYTINGKEILID